MQPRENFVGFDFSALAFSSPLKTQFLYKLVGVDEDWKNPGDKRYVSYTQLKGGHYDFLLKAAGAAG
ncbi:MAG: triple tyrosine motif-containing protein [Bacteroidota bacterium]